MKKILSIILSILMVVTMLPMAAYAATGGSSGDGANFTINNETLTQTFGIESHEHDWSNLDGVCAGGCGFECAHENYNNGVCITCGYICMHKNVANGMCLDCDSSHKYITFHMYDVYGDGWNDAGIIVSKLLADGSFKEIGTVTLEEGRDDTDLFIITESDIYSLKWKSGSADSESNFEVIDNGKTVLESKRCDDYYDGEILYINCEHTFENGVCEVCGTACTHKNVGDGECLDCDLTGTIVTISMFDSYGDSWNDANIIIGKLLAGGSSETIGVATLPKEEEGTYNFFIDKNDAFTLKWDKGKHDDDCTFKVLVDGETVFESENCANYEDGEVVYTYCKHTFENCICIFCGYECTHEKYTGEACEICEICGATLHIDKDGNEYCDDCDTLIGAKVLTSDGVYLYIDGVKAETTGSRQLLPTGNYIPAGDITTSYNVYVDNGESVTLDLNGYTWYSNTLSIDGAFSLYDTSENETGKIASNDEAYTISVRDYGRFSLYSGAVENVNAGPDACAVAAHANVSINLYGGKLKSKVHPVYYSLYSDVTVNLDGTVLECGESHPQFVTDGYSDAPATSVIDVTDYKGGKLAVEIGNSNTTDKITVFTGISSAQEAENYTVQDVFEDDYLNVSIVKTEYDEAAGELSVYLGESTFTQQPTSENNYTVDFNTLDASFLWYEIENPLLTSDNVTASAVFENGKWLCGAGKYTKLFAFDTKAGDILEISSNSSEEFSLDINNEDWTLEENIDITGSGSFTVSEDAKLTVWVDAYNVSEDLEIEFSILRIIEELDSETGKTLQNPECSKTYSCQATTKKGYVCSSDAVTVAHTGGTATCTELAVCSVCGESYGEVNAHDWSNLDGVCANGCGEVCPHEKYTNGVCDKCGYDCPHDSYTNGFCTECDDYEPAVDSDSDGYYEIGNAGQLYWFADKAKNDRTNYGSANAILTQNIVVNENVLTADGKLNGFGSDFRAWIPPYAYKGTFDGAGKTVSGLYFKDTEERDVGFIGYLYGGTVKNLTVKDSYFNAYSAVGGIVGSVIEGTVTDCFSSATVIAGSLGYAGGIAGENGAGLVERCANSGFVTSGYEAGGIVGYNHNYYDDPDPAIIRHCYNIGSVSGYTVGGIVGFATQQMGSSVEIDSCWAACELNGTNSVGGLIGHASGSTIRCCSYDKTVFTGNPVGKKTSCNILDSGFKSTEEFASGAAAYLLNGKSSGGFWRQTIGTDAYPGFSGDKVYYGYISCADNAKKVYTNDATATEVKPAHNWSNNDGICANGCGYECTHVSYTGGVCDNCNYECPHAWGEGVLTRPTFETDGYYTYTCTLCGHSYTEPAKEADTTALNDASMKVTEYIDNDTLTQEAKDEIYKSYRDIVRDNGSIFDEFGFARGDLVEEDQPAINAVTEELQKIIDEAEEKIASGEYVKADYTDIEEVIKALDEKLVDENVTDEGKAGLEEIKKQLEEMKADENTSEADLVELEKALGEYEEELDKGIEDGTLVKIDGDKLVIESNKKFAEKLEAEGLLDEYKDFKANQKATDEALAAIMEVNELLYSLEGTVAENAENIEKINEMMDYVFTSWENCLRGTHNFNDYEVTSSAKCEVNAIETSTCWFCGETDEREIEGTALSHSFTKYEETEAPKCGVAGKEVAYCDNGCQTTDERETPALEHIFLDYVSNGDATCTSDGTKTATCLNGCGATDTVADEGTMLDHIDEDGDKLCDDCGGELYERCDICGGKAHGDDKIQILFCMIITIIRFVTSILKSIN